MQTVGIVLNVNANKADEFEQGFRDQEAPIWSRRRGAVPGGRHLRDR
jgi:hypothetical protein